ncbi:MAG TPA: trypsin-like peptidase domain-containing protein [Polyangia bacterium]|nr:trypsin-like peptidase domain-containing protein [Polyangia bacterium]
MAAALAALILIGNVQGAPSLARYVGPMTAPVVNVHASRRTLASAVPLVGSFLPSREVHAVGSGVVIAGDGLVLTNEHIIHGSPEVRVAIGEREYPAQVVGADTELDIALLRVEAPVRLQAARLGRSSHLRVGDYVVAVGNPYGLDHTVTSGIVSANARVLGVGPPAPLIQTDASINPGNSGGPLYTLDGKVVALNVAIVAGANGIGFALPIDVVRRALPQLEREGRIQRGFVGVKVSSVSEELARAEGLHHVSGALVDGVEPGGPGAHAGILPGDVILRWDGEPVVSDASLHWLVALTPPGSRVDVVVMREGDPVACRVAVGALGHDAGP